MILSQSLILTFMTFRFPLRVGQIVHEANQIYSQFFKSFLVALEGEKGQLTKSLFVSLLGDFSFFFLFSFHQQRLIIYTFFLS